MGGIASVAAASTSVHPREGGRRGGRDCRDGTSGAVSRPRASTAGGASGRPGRTRLAALAYPPRRRWAEGTRRWAGGRGGRPRPARASWLPGTQTTAPAPARAAEAGGGGVRVAHTGGGAPTPPPPRGAAGDSGPHRTVERVWAGWARRRGACAGACAAAAPPAPPRQAIARGGGPGHHERHAASPPPARAAPPAGRVNSVGIWRCSGFLWAHQPTGVNQLSRRRPPFRPDCVEGWVGEPRASVGPLPSYPQAVAPRA